MASAIATQEPSMEEILASIRQIISEDGGNGEAAAPDAPVAEISPPAHAPAPMMSVAPPAEVARPQPVEAAPPPFAASPSAMPSPTQKEPAPMPFAAASPAPQAAPAAPANDARLLSPDSDAVVSGAFSALAHTILAQNARTLEDLVCEMLRPMLKDWLDDNLPPLVERMVGEEIHRVSRPRR